MVNDLFTTPLEGKKCAYEVLTIINFQKKIKSSISFLFKVIPFLKLIVLRCCGMFATTAELNSHICKDTNSFSVSCAII